MHGGGPRGGHLGCQRRPQSAPDREPGATSVAIRLAGRGPERIGLPPDAYVRHRRCTFPRWRGESRVAPPGGTVMRIRRHKPIRLMRRDRPRWIDRYIDYFAAAK